MSLPWRRGGSLSQQLDKFTNGQQEQRPGEDKDQGRQSLPSKEDRSINQSATRTHTQEPAANRVHFPQPTTGQRTDTGLALQMGRMNVGEHHGGSAAREISITSAALRAEGTSDSTQDTTGSTHIPVFPPRQVVNMGYEQVHFQEKFYPPGGRQYNPKMVLSLENGQFEHVGSFLGSTAPVGTRRHTLETTTVGFAQFLHRKNPETTDVPYHAINITFPIVYSGPDKKSHRAEIKFSPGNHRVSTRWLTRSQADYLGLPDSITDPNNFGDDILEATFQFLPDSERSVKGTPSPVVCESARRDRLFDEVTDLVTIGTKFTLYSTVELGECDGKADTREKRRLQFSPFASNA